jgi:hypothetical protein
VRSLIVGGAAEGVCIGARWMSEPELESEEGIKVTSSQKGTTERAYWQLAGNSSILGGRESTHVEKYL